MRRHPGKNKEYDPKEILKNLQAISPREEKKEKENKKQEKEPINNPNKLL